MHFVVILYLCLAPLFGLVMFFIFNKRAIQKRWWLYRHPQSVYKAIFHYPNKMYAERFIHSSKETFEYDNGTYNIKKEAIIRKNWYGFRGNQSFDLNEGNTIDFEKYRLFVDGEFRDLPNTAQMIGELHYIIDFPDPLIFADVNSLINGFSSENLVIPLRTAGEQNRVEKNSVLDQLITAEFKKVTLMIIIVLVIIVLLISAYQLALRLELIDTPLHAVCVNVGGGVVGK